MRVLLFLAKGFEHMETGGFRGQVNSTFNVPIVVDKLIDEINVEDYDALVIPGGFQEYGFQEEAFDEKFLNLIRAFNAKDRIIATVCVAALALGKSGVLVGRKGTTYHLKDGVRLQELASYGVEVVREPVVVDNNIITSYCPETAVKVAFRLLEMLTSPEQAANVKRIMGYE